MKDLQSKQRPTVMSEPRSPAHRTGKYIYAFVAAPANRAFSEIGIDGGSVYAISYGNVAAIVSDVPAGRLRPERRHLEAHNRVIKQLVAGATVLPMVFGTLADSHAAVRRVLALNEENLAEQLHRVDHKLEMGLRVVWDVPNIFEYFVQTHPELRAIRDRLLGQHHAPTQEDKIEVGRMFDQLLNDDRETHTGVVESVLSKCCIDFRRNRCRNEQDIMNLACLIGRDAQPDFEAAVLAAAKLFDNNFAFDYNGPWAPHSFVNPSLNA